MGMSCEDDGIFPLGSFVEIKCGSYAGSVCVVIGIDRNTRSNGKILIADGKKISVKKPKRKNARHIQATGRVVGEVARRLAGGKRLDDGWLHEILTVADLNNSQLVTEEDGSYEWQKMM